MSSYKFALARNGRSPAFHVLAVVLVTLAINGLIFALGWVGPSVDAARHNALLPPGWVVGGVWLVLLVLLAVAFWLLASEGRPEVRRLSPWVLALIGFCLAYPFYTIGLRNETLSLIANLATISASSFLAGCVLGSSRPAALFIFMPAPWVSFATFAVVLGR
jgi:tryptophan-rich sensory protein